MAEKIRNRKTVDFRTTKVKVKEAAENKPEAKEDTENK